MNSRQCEPSGPKWEWPQVGNAQVGMVLRGNAPELRKELAAVRAERLLRRFVRRQHLFVESYLIVTAAWSPCACVCVCVRACARVRACVTG
jgi:hypothetical protein